MATKKITYVGSGDTPPHIINFMGEQVFRRGEVVEIEDCKANKHLLAKIAGNKSFTEEVVTPKELQDNDVAAEKKRKKQIKEDIEVNRREVARRK